MPVLPNDELFCKERGLVQYVKDNSRFKLVNILNDKEAIAVIQAHIVKVYGGLVLLKVNNVWLLDIWL